MKKKAITSQYAFLHAGGPTVLIIQLNARPQYIDIVPLDRRTAISRDAAAMQSDEEEKTIRSLDTPLKRLSYNPKSNGTHAVEDPN